MWSGKNRQFILIKISEKSINENVKLPALINDDLLFEIKIFRNRLSYTINTYVVHIM